jgi:hypothetical protein
MGYAAAYKPDSEPLGQFIQRKGGIDACAGSPGVGVWGEVLGYGDTQGTARLPPSTRRGDHAGRGPILPVGGGTAPPQAQHIVQLANRQEGRGRSVVGLTEVNEFSCVFWLYAKLER